MQTRRYDSFHLNEMVLVVQSFLCFLRESFFIIFDIIHGFLIFLIVRRYKIGSKTYIYSKATESDANDVSSYSMKKSTAAAQKQIQEPGKAI